MEVTPLRRQALAIEVREGSQVAEARRRAARLAEALGYAEGRGGDVALVVSEVASNLVKHTPSGGWLLVIPLALAEGAALDVLGLDRGPGIAEISESLRDGVSTTGTLGTGLGAIRRLSDVFDLYSEPGAGTAVFARLLARRPEPGAGPGPAPSRWEVGGFSLPRRGEELSGDGWLFRLDGPRLALLVVDGLGHGPLASEVSDQAIHHFGRLKDLAPTAVVERMHEVLRHTRGAAVSALVVEPETRQVRAVGVGNVMACVVAGEGRRHLVSQNGIAGLGLIRLKEQSLPWGKGALAVMHSDGLATRWNLAEYAGLGSRHAALIAGVLFRDHRREQDDVTVVVARQRQRHPMPWAPSAS